MSSESGRRLSTEELKRLNQSSKAAPPPMVLLREADWKELLDRLEASAAAQETLLRALSQQAGQCPTQAQMEALTRDVAQMRAEWKQAGRKRAFYLAAQSPDRAVSLDLAGPDPAGGHGWHGGLADDLVRLGHTLEGDPDAVPVRDATTMHQHADRKTLRRERAKKIALGHRPDDREDEIDMTMKGY